jgi:predicted component of type VI protein secretion system
VTEEAVPETVVEEPTVVPAAVVEEPLPEPVAEPEPVVEPAPPPPPPGPPTCPACSAEIEAGDKFCSNCGYKLEAEPAPAPVAPAPPPPSVGRRLVVVASGAEIPLPTGGEILIGREDPISGVFPDVDLTPHEGEEGGVSRQHARLIIEGANYYVEDLDSTNYTFLNKQKLAPKTRHPLHDGDEIRCGRVALVLKTG